MKKLPLILFFLMFFSFVKGQYISEFSRDTARYISELKTLFGNSLMDEENLIFKEFTVVWDSMDYRYQEDIMAVSDLMRLRTCRPRPHYINFIRILTEFHGRNKIHYGYEDWIEGYKSFMGSEKTLLKDINKVNQTILSLLEKNEMYTSSSLVWAFSDSTFSWRYVDGLRIIVKQMGIIGSSSGDSIRIHNVDGYYDPVAQVFSAASGRVYWDRAGLSPEVVFAELQGFRIDMSKPSYSADSVVFHHNQLLDRPAEGRLEDRITRIKNPEQAKYPKFITYQSSYQLNEIVPGINYTGAISMEGANLAGTGAAGKKAQLDIFYQDTLTIHMNAGLFLFGKTLIHSANAEVSIYIEDDSIYHPDLVMTYDIKSEQLRLNRSQDYNSQGPYSDSYHNIDISFDELSWIRSKPEMKMQAALGTALGNGLFESYDFFDMNFFESLQGMEYQHPLADLWLYADMLGGNTFSVEGYAGYMGKQAYMMRQQLMQFSKLGFVYFDFNSDLVTLRPKLYDYIDASLMKRDYDVIRFISRTNAGLENAKLDLATNDLTIHGIPTIFLSDSQNVKLVPSNNTIIMKRNRDFQFDGIIDAGLFKFYGKNFFFEYDNFKINLQNIDSLSISARTGERDAYGTPLITTLDNMIQKITGELLIDAPFNKSGLNSYPEYPIFTSREESYVFFDKKSIQNGVYDRDRFYFQLRPFSIDSLDNFRREAMKMEGTFVSADILPPLEMEMSLRPDNSLGYYLTTPETGIPIFGGKATFFNDLEMSSAGLHGYGSLDYLTSTTWSDDFLFHPDSIMTTTRRFLERESNAPVSYPFVENDVASMTYYPFEDEMHISRIKNVFRIFSDSVFFSGGLTLRPAGLSGDGALAFSDARFDSRNFNFLAQRIKADSSGVKLKKPGTDDFALLTDDLKIDVDLVKREGDFSARADYTYIDLPLNLYETRLDRLTWFMDADEVLMSQSKYLPGFDLSVDIDSLRTNGPTYVSKHPKQDSLRFIAPMAYFNYSDRVLDAQKVTLLDIADSYILPDEGNVQVLEKATIKPLRDAKLIANKDSRYHLLHSANLVVDSRIHFRGSASYDYLDEFGNVSTFRMEHVEADTSLNTFGEGEIAASDSFMLSPFFSYKGRVYMDASDPLLNFDGGVRLSQACDLGRQWLKFTTRIDPDSILIPVDERMQNQDLNNIFAGTLKARDSIHIYPTFLSGRKDYFDSNVTGSSGFLYYDKAERRYEIAADEKLEDMDAEGNYLALLTDSCWLYSEGEIDLQVEYGRMSMKTFGTAVHKIPENSLDLRVVMGLNFHFSDAALTIFGNELDSLPGLEPVDITTPFYRRAVRNMVGKPLADKLENELGLYGNYTVIPDSMKFSILFNDVKLEWNQETRSYRYSGPVGIGTIGNVQVNRKVNAYMEFVERGSGDIFDIYLYVDDNTWYYMAFSPGALQVLSTNDAFNQAILAVPEKERQLKSSGRQKSYIYSLSSNRRLSLFMDRFLMGEEQVTE